MQSKLWVFFAALAASLLTTAAGVSAATTQETVTIQVVDYSKKPPYPRKTMQVPVENVAQLEPVARSASAEWVEVRTVDMSGKPPYKRTIERLPVVDAAQFETSKAETRGVKGHYPPFKRH